MDVECSSSFERLKDYVNSEGSCSSRYWPFQNNWWWYRTSYRQKKLTSDTDMHQVTNCRICLDRPNPKSKCPHISSPETFVRTCIRHFHNHTSEYMTSQPHERRQVRNQRLRPPSRAQQNQQMPLTAQYDNYPLHKVGYRICSEPLQRRSAEARDVLTGQFPTF